MDEYRPKIEVRRNVRDHPTRPHAQYVDSTLWVYPTDAEASAWEQYAADAEVGARVRQADGDGVRAERAAEWWPHRDGTYGVRLLGETVQVSGASWFYTEADADAFIARLAATPAPALPAGMVEVDGEILCRGIDIPEGWDFYGPPETIGADEDDSRPWWDWRDRETDVRTGNAWYAVRRKVVPPAPRTVDVPWLEALRDQREVQRDHPIRVCEMVNGEPRLSWVGGYTDGDWWGGAVRINPDGTVTVLADRADDIAPSGDQS